MITEALLSASAAVTQRAAAYAAELVHRDLTTEGELDWRSRASVVAANMAVQEALLRVAANEPDREKQKRAVQQALEVAALSERMLSEALAPQSESESLALQSARAALLRFLKAGKAVAGAVAKGFGTAILIAAVGLGIGLALMKGGRS